MNHAGIQSRWKQNAIANLVSGLSIAFFNLLVPAILTRELSHTDLTIWSLSLQVIIYLQVFNGGIPTALTQFIASSDSQKKNEIYSSGVLASLSVSVVAIIAIFSLILFYTRIYPNFSKEMQENLKHLSLIIGFGYSIQMLALCPAGLFFGTYKNIYWTLSNVIPRLFFLAIAFLAIFMSLSFSVKEFAAILALSFILIPVLSYVIVAKKYREIFFSISMINWGVFKKIMTFSAEHALWGASTLVVSAVTVSIVANNDQENVAPFTMSVALISVSVGFLQAILNPMIGEVSRIKNDANASEKISAVLYKSTRKCTVYLVFCCIAFFALGEYLTQIWVGRIYAKTVFDIAKLLLISMAIRNICLPLSMCVLAIRSPRVGLDITLSEGLFNLILAFILCRNFGVLGVGYAAIFSSTLSMLMCIYLLIPRVGVLGSRVKFIKSSFCEI